MKVKFKRFDEAAKLPTKAYANDFCYDCYAVREEQIAPNVWKYYLGFGLQIERGVEQLGQGQELDLRNSPVNLSFDFRPRSSVWKTGMVMSNCEGTVDEGYTNEISAVFYHVMPNMPRYRVGDKVCQMKIGGTFPIKFVEVDDLNQTERGMNGYGCSGQK